MPAEDLVQEAASSLAAMGWDPAGLVISCRRLVEHHPGAGPLWSLCARVLVSGEPSAEVRRALADLDAGDLTSVLAAAFPDEATVVTVGWSDLVGGALGRRGDVTALVVDGGDGNGHALARALEGHDVDAVAVPDAGVAAAVARADVVVVEATAAGPDFVLATTGTAAAAAVGYTQQVPVWVVLRPGTVLPGPLFDACVAHVAGSDEPWEEAEELVPVPLLTVAVTVDGVVDRDIALGAPSCPLAPELLKFPA